MLTSDNTRLSQAYIEQKFQTLDQDGDGFIDIRDYKQTLKSDPDFFDFYALFNFGGSISIEKEKEIIQQKLWRENGTYHDIKDHDLDEIKILKQVEDMKNNIKEIKQFSEISFAVP